MASTQNLLIRPVEINTPVDNATDQSYQFEVRDAEGGEVDLRGYTAVMQLRPYPKSKKIYDELTTENGRLAIKGATVYITFPAGVSAGYKFDTAVYDLVIVSLGGLKYRIAQGVIRTTPQVTVVDL